MKKDNNKLWKYFKRTFNVWVKFLKYFGIYFVSMSFFSMILYGILRSYFQDALLIVIGVNSAVSVIMAFPELMEDFISGKVSEFNKKEAAYLREIGKLKQEMEKEKKMREEAEKVTAVQKVLNVVLDSDEKVLDDVVVVGAGTQKKVSVTGAITSMKGSELKAPSSSLTNNLAGKLAGVVAVTTSGEPGSASDFYIRGVGTFGGRATPLILLDDVEISSGDLNRIPAENIESFSIL